MRYALRQECLAEREPIGEPDHLGLAYGAWAPIGPGGKVTDNRRAGWLDSLCRRNIAADYPAAYERWRASFTDAGDRLMIVTAASRVLVGHGNVSPTEVGLTVHQTWGVPVIPGSALKGLAANYVDATLGPEDPTWPPWLHEEGSPEIERARFQGVTWSPDNRRILRGPGQHYRALFGAPDADHDTEMQEHQLPAGREQGLVKFHDALYVPSSGNVRDRPFAPDVLTVHQKNYYNAMAGDPRQMPWPSDWDDPNPVQFISVRKGARFLLALSGPKDWTAIAMSLLHEALIDWGIGGKTSSGYGRVERASETPPSAQLEEFLKWLENPVLSQRAQLVNATSILREIEARKMPFLLRLSAEDRQAAARAIERSKRVASSDARQLRAAVIAQLLAA